MKKFLLVGILFASIPFISFAQVAATTSGATTAPTPVVMPATPGLLPTDFFYFLDRWGEGVRTFFTFNKEAKARLHLEYAKERASEIKAVLSDPKAKLEDVASAKDNFNQQIASAATIIKEEKSKGVDVSSLAGELDSELNASRDEIKSTLGEHESRATIAEQQIRAKLSTLSPSDPQFEGLSQALASITKEKDSAAKDSDSLDESLSEDQATLEDAMGPQMTAEKRMEEVKHLNELRNEMGLISGASSTTTVQMMKQAQEAMMRGDFETAKNMSEQAKHLFEKSQEGNAAPGDLPDSEIDSSINGKNEGGN